MNKTRIAHYIMNKDEVQQCKKVIANIRAIDSTIELYVGKVIQCLLHGVESLHLIVMGLQDEQQNGFKYYIVQVLGFNNFKLIKIDNEEYQCSIEQAIINALPKKGA